MSRANFVQAKLASAATSAATSLTIQSGGAAFALPPTDGGRLTLTDSLGAPAAYEIVTYASRTGTGPNYTLNGVVRGVEGSAARAWSAGAFVLQSLTAGEFDELLNAKEPSIAAATGSNTQFWRGDKTWQDLATAVRAAVLTGLSTASSAAVVVTDTLLVAIGKLQAQITGLSTSKLDTNGSAANLTSIPAAQLSGVVPDANLSGTYTGVSITGNAATATKLATARTINGVAFDGTVNITVTDGTKLPTTGGTLTGALTAPVDSVQYAQEKVQALGAGSGTRTVDVTSGAYIQATANSTAATWTFNVAPSGSYVTSWTLELVNGGLSAQTFTGVLWVGGTAPELSPSGTDVLVFTRVGTTTRGYLAAKDSR